MQKEILKQYLEKLLHQNTPILPRARLNRLQDFKFEDYSYKILTPSDKLQTRQFMLENFYNEAPVARALKIYKGPSDNIQPAIDEEINYFINRGVSYGCFHENQRKKYQLINNFYFLIWLFSVIYVGFSLAVDLSEPSLLPQAVHGVKALDYHNVAATVATKSKNPVCT